MDINAIATNPLIWDRACGGKLVLHEVIPAWVGPWYIPLFIVDTMHMLIYETNTSVDKTSYEY